MNFKVAQAKIQKFGSVLSAMVMPNIGVFIGWGLLTALFIPTGWLPNKQLNELVSPILTYLLPSLIGFAAGSNIYGRRGGVIGAFATLGVVVGSDVTMLIGGMIMGPLAAVLLRKFDNAVKGKIKPGLEMLVDNFSLGIIGFILCVFGFLAVAPVITGLQNFLGSGVSYLTQHNLIPLTSIFVQPGDILFLNNAINHGIMVPLGLQQVTAAGKSILFLVEANGSIWVGVAAAFAVFGTGIAKKTAPGAVAIMFFGGIAEVVFPYCLMMPLTILGPIAGNMASLTILSVFHGGAVGPVSPGSVFAYFMMTPKDSILVNGAAYVAGLVVTFIVSGFILKVFHQPEDGKTAKATADNDSVTDNATIKPVKSLGSVDKLDTIIFACDAGMGSSAMGASILQDRLKKVGLTPTVKHMAVAEVDQNADLIITNENLEERASQMSDGKIPIITLKNFMDANEYGSIVKQIQTMSDSADGVIPSEATKDEHETVAQTTEAGHIFPEKNIVLNASFKDKKAAITATADLLIKGGYVTPHYKQEMFARDEDLSVYMGNGIALPHGLTQSDSILHSGICFIQVPEGVDFDGNTVYIIVGVAGKGEEHVKILGQIGQRLTEEENINVLRTAETKSDVRKIFDLA